MYSLKARSGQNRSNEVVFASNPRAGRQVAHSRQPLFHSNRGDEHGRPISTGGEGYRRLKNRLISRGIPEGVVEELLEQPTIISYSKGSFIFLDGAPTDLLFCVSSGLVEILCPGTDGEQIRTSVLGPGEFFGFVERVDEKGRSAQAFQARARTNAQIGLVVRDHIYKVLMRQDPNLLLHIMKEIVAAWSELTLQYVQFLGKNYNGRLEAVLADLAIRFGVKESRGTLLVPEFGHSDFAEMIGCSRPMVSRLIAEMISAGSLAQDGKHYILADDPTLLSSKRAVS
jgi:CRP/FNR family cyclic AMP-dependent transcriptional regulator